jgi:anti-anti-sigma regulatory factor
MKRTRTVDGKLHLVGAKDNVLDVFKLTMLDKVFNFFPTLEAAIQGF